MPRSQPHDELTGQELRGVLDEEIGRLPEKYRSAVVLCHLEGKSYEQAAQELRCPKSTLASRLGKALELLRTQLTRRGLALSAGALATALAEKTVAAPVPALLAANIMKAAASVAAGKTLAAGILSTQTIALAEEAMKTMIGIKSKLVVLLALALAVGAGYAGFSAWVGPPPPKADDKQPPVVQGEPVKKDAPGPALDRNGDSLPRGAVARLGTTRFRHGLNAVAMAYSPDGKLLASLDGSVLFVLEASTGKVLHRHSFETTPRFLPLTENRGLAFSSNSKTIVTPRAVIDVATGKELRQLQEDKSKEILRQFEEEGVLVDPTASAWTAAVSPDGKSLARQVWAGKGTGVILIDVATGKVRRLGWNDKEVKAAWFGKPKDGAKPPPQPVFSSNGTLLATASDDKVIRLWEVETGKELHRLQGHEQAVKHLAISPDGKVLASTGQGEGLIQLWDVPVGKTLREIKIDAPNVGIWFAPDGKLITTDSGAGTIRLYDCGSGKELRRWQMPCACVAFSPDGKVLATAARQDLIVHRWDMHADKSLDDASRNHIKAVGSLRFAPDGKTLYSLDVGLIAMEWDLATMRSPNTTFAGPVASVKMPAVGDRVNAQHVKLSPTGKVAAVEHSEPRGRELSERAVYLCDVFTGKVLHILRGEHKDRAYLPEFSPDGKIVAMTWEDKERLWDVATGKPLPHPPLPPGFVKAWSADGKLLALYVGKKGERRIHLCEVATGKEIRRLTLPESKDPAGWWAIALSADFRSLACFSREELVILDTESGKERLFPMKATGNTSMVEFSPSGEYLAAATGDTIQLWEVRSGQKIREFPAGHSMVTLRFSPDGRTLASGGEDSTILLWDLTKVQRPAAPAKTLRPADLEECWQALADDDAKRAFDALCDLAAAPKDAVPFLKDRVKPAAPLDRKRITELIAQLDDNQFKVREQAAGELLKLGEQLVPVLDKALAADPPRESKRRLEELRSKMTGMVLQGDRLRAFRAVEVLELIGTPESRQVLQALADGTPGALLTTSAQAALKRARRTD